VRPKELTAYKNTRGKTYLDGDGAGVAAIVRGQGLHGVHHGESLLLESPGASLSDPERQKLGLGGRHGHGVRPAERCQKKYVLSAGAAETYAAPQLLHS